MNMIKTESKDMCSMVVSHSNSMHRDMDLFDNHIEIERDHTGSRKVVTPPRDSSKNSLKRKRI